MSALRIARRIVIAGLALAACTLTNTPPADGPGEGAKAPVASVATEGPFAGYELVAISNGPNAIDLDGDGRLDQVFGAWRENFNAHGYTRSSFFRADSAGPWELMPFFDENGDSKSDSF